MLKIFRTLFFALFLTSAYSQNNIFFHIGPAFPLSDFGDDNDKNDEAKGAGLGFDCGLKYIHQLNASGLGVFGQFDFIYNSLTNRFKDELEDYYKRNFNQVEFKHHKYLNFPLLFGINYTHAVNDKTKLFGEFGLGVNFLKITNYKITLISVDHTFELRNFSLSSKLAYKLGGGIIFKDKFYFSLNYSGLGKHDPKYEVVENAQVIDTEYADKFLISMFTLNLGIKIK